MKGQNTTTDNITYEQWVNELNIKHEQVWVDHEEWVDLKKWVEEIDKKYNPAFRLFILGF